MCCWECDCQWRDISVTSIVPLSSHSGPSVLCGEIFFHMWLHATFDLLKRVGVRGHMTLGVRVECASQYMGGSRYVCVCVTQIHKPAKQLAGSTPQVCVCVCVLDAEPLSLSKAKSGAECRATRSTIIRSQSTDSMPSSHDPSADLASMLYSVSTSAAFNLIQVTECLRALRSAPPASVLK